MLGEQTIQSFLDKVALEPATPAGGSIAALTAACAAALAEMSCRLTIGKSGYEQANSEMHRISKTCSDYRAQFIADLDNDSKAFDEVLQAFKLPAESETEQMLKEKQIQSSYKAAVEVPARMAERAFEMLQYIKLLFEKGSKSTMTDAAQAHMLTEAAIRSLVYHIKANLMWIEDKDYVDRMTKIAEKLMAGC